MPITSAQLLAYLGPYASTRLIGLLSHGLRRISRRYKTRKTVSFVLHELRACDHGLSTRLVRPEPFESVGRHLGVPDGVLNISVTQIVLDGSCVVTVICQLEAAGVPEHVRVHWETELCRLASSSDDFPHGRIGHRAP